MQIPSGYDRAGRTPGAEEDLLDVIHGAEFGCGLCAAADVGTAGNDSDCVDQLVGGLPQ